MWNKVMEDFDYFEALTPNETALCSVNFTSSAKGKSIVVAVDTVNDLFSHYLK